VRWRDEELVPISALQHWIYCPRQCALIHVEQVFEENVFTLRGQAVHKQVDIPETEMQGSLRIERALPLCSEKLGLVGRADVVEFREDTPYPIDYKLGPRRAKVADDVQLCAQAICLEEMLGASVMRGAIFHHKSRRRREVVFSPSLRNLVGQTTQEVRNLIKTFKVPSPVADARCRHCSLHEACMPNILSSRELLSGFEKRLFDE